MSSAYRQPDQRSPTEPTRIEYVSRLLRLRVFFFGALVVFFALGILSSIHATHFRCSRGEDPSGVVGLCTIDQYAIIAGPRHRDISLDNIAHFDVQIRSGSKGGKYAVVNLVNRGGESVNLAEGALLAQFDPTSAENARSEYAVFAMNPSERDLDVWLTQSTAGNVIAALFALVLLAFAFVMVREQIATFKPIRILVDHDRNVVVMRGREIPIRDIASVKLETGRALFWSSGKNEHIPGWRIVVVTESIGEEIAATKDFRAGPIAEHERARTALAKAISDA